MGGGDQRSVPTPSAYDDGIYRPAAMVYELHVFIPPQSPPEDQDPSATFARWLPNVEGRGESEN